MPTVRAVAEAERASSAPEGVSVSIDNSQADATVISVEGYNRPGLLTALTATFRDLGLDVTKARDLPQITCCRNAAAKSNASQFSHLLTIGEQEAL
jgi:glycine cleavage system regulatory protein